MKKMFLSLPKPEKKILLLGIIALAIAAFFSEGYYHVDEHYQILEFASKKLGTTHEHEMPWEWYEQMRPTLQPWIAILAHKFLYSLGDQNHFHVALILRLLSAVMAILTSLLMYRSFSQYYQEWQKKWLLAFGFFVWFMPYLMVRFSSENWGAMLFFIAVALIFNQSSISLRKWIFIGFLLAISFFIRFQMVFAIMGLLGYLFYTKRLVISNSWMIVSGALLGLSAMVFLDYLYYDTFVFTPWQYFDQNILQDKAATFGVDPWWMYFGWFFDEARMPISLLIFYGFIRLVKRKELNVMSWVLLPFVLGHFLVGHKELRFLFPMVYLIPFAAAESTYLLSFWKNKLAIRKIVLSALIIMNLGLLLFICFIPAKPFIQVYHQLNTRIEPNAVVFAAAHESSEWNYPLHYYMPQEMIFLPKDSSQSFARINDLPHYVFIKKSQRHEFSLYLGDSICATIPNWMYSMNFNGWVDREKNFLIYRLKE